MWKQYQIKTANKSPSRLLQNAQKYAKKGNALDLGAGGLRDTKYLAKKGFLVDSVDIQFASKPRIKGVAYFKQPFHRFKFFPKRYDLINFQYSLPFTKTQTFDSIWGKLVRSLKNNGVIVGQLFGVDDEWNIKGSPMTFHTKKEALKMLAPLEVIFFKEEKKRKMTFRGKMKQWHIFHIIARLEDEKQ